MIAFNISELKKLSIYIEAHNWYKSQIISEMQWRNIQKEYSSKLYHPPIWLRCLLFVATIIGINAGLGLVGSVFLSNGFDNDYVIRLFFGITGLGYLLFHEYVIIQSKRHYKSGVSEAFLFLGLIQTIVAIYWNDDINFFLTLLVFSSGIFIAIRYLNLVGVIVSIFAFAYFIFNLLFQLGGITQTIIPFAFILIFGLLFIWSQVIQSSYHLPLFKDHFIVLDILLLILCYLGGNYFVVRELSLEMMGLHLAPEQDIPFAFVFYFLTVTVPLAYLGFGIKRKSILLIRTGILILFVSVITFKYYYSSGHPEISLTISGSIILLLAVWALNYLKTIRNGYTREPLLSDKWSNLNAESILISSTMGGNSDLSDHSTEYGGGQFGGGGAGDQF
jgi:uncharacterized membrane protein YgcG